MLLPADILLDFISNISFFRLDGTSDRKLPAVPSHSLSAREGGAEVERDISTTGDLTHRNPTASGELGVSPLPRNSKEEEGERSSFASSPTFRCNRRPSFSGIKFKGKPSKLLADFQPPPVSEKEARRFYSNITCGTLGCSSKFEQDGLMWFLMMFPLPKNAPRHGVVRNHPKGLVCLKCYPRPRQVTGKKKALHPRLLLNATDAQEITGQIPGFLFNFKKFAYHEVTKPEYVKYAMCAGEDLHAKYEE